MARCQLRVSANVFNAILPIPTPVQDNLLSWNQTAGTQLEVSIVSDFKIA
ncbi:MAG: hypothetical protein P8X79_18735 [Reinekea sp.]